MWKFGGHSKRGKAVMKAMTWLGGTMVGFLILVMAFVLFGPRFGWRVDTVLSGSMAPAFGAGDAVVIQEVDPAAVKVGDIITYRGPDNSRTIVSHRVVDITQRPQPVFTTKGDANEEVDNYTVPAQNVIGVVKFSVPLVGYFANFAKTRTGLIVLLIVPGLLVIGNEMRRIWVALSAMEKKKQHGSPAEGEPS